MPQQQNLLVARRSICQACTAERTDAAHPGKMFLVLLPPSQTCQLLEQPHQSTGTNLICHSCLQTDTQRHHTPMSAEMAHLGRVLVTGASGNVGREVMTSCTARGFTCRAAGSNPEALARSFPSSETVKLDFLD